MNQTPLGYNPSNNTGRSRHLIKPAKSAFLYLAHLKCDAPVFSIFFIFFLNCFFFESLIFAWIALSGFQSTGTLIFAYVAFSGF
jgi:hypothetical protein